MSVIINDRSYQAELGQRVIDVARLNHSHIGYFCGGNGICQTCYVKVIEGSELLSPVSDREKAMLSDRLLEEGTRMACIATIEKPGTVQMISAVEEVKRMYETAPARLPEYSAKMGWEALVKFPETVALQIRRTIDGHFDLLQIFSDVIQSIGDAWLLAIDSFTAKQTREPGANSKEENLPAKTSASLSVNGCCAVFGSLHSEKAPEQATHAESGVPA